MDKATTSFPSGAAAPNLQHHDFCVMYGVISNPSSGDLADHLGMRLDHLAAMMAPVIGEAGEAFRQMPGATQDTFFRACLELVGECRELARKIAETEGAA